MESDCTLRFGLNAIVKSISYTQICFCTSEALRNALAGPEVLATACLIVFDNGGGLLFIYRFKCCDLHVYIFLS